MSSNAWSITGLRDEAEAQELRAEACDRLGLPGLAQNARDKAAHFRRQIADMEREREQERKIEAEMDRIRRERRKKR